MAKPKKHPVIAIRHEDGTVVYQWEEDRGLELIGSCLRRKERVEVFTEEMTKREYHELPNYEGEC